MDLRHPFLKFILKSNLFISLCATDLSLETSVILKSGFQSGWLYAFVFFATLCSYNLYYIKSSDFPYHRSMALLGLFGSIVSLILMPSIPYVYLGIITLLSSLYLLPVFVSFRKPDSYSALRLFMLILVWVLFTFQFPAPHHLFDWRYGLLLLYRILLLSHLCVLFFIRDERNPSLKRTAEIALIPLGLLQGLVCVLIMLHGDYSLSIIYLTITLLTIKVSSRSIRSSRSNFHYLLFVDGIMLLQSIFVLFKFLITP